MIRSRFGLVLILLVLILLIVSTLFALLTYWLDEEGFEPNGGSQGAAARNVTVLCADVAGEPAALQQRIAEQFYCTELRVTELTPMMGVHTIPGVPGVVFFAD
jgi:hypothetical protein